MQRSHFWTMTGAESFDPDHEAAIRITGSIKDTILRNPASSPDFRAAVWQEILPLERAGDRLISRSLLADYFPDEDHTVLERAAHMA